MGPSFSVPHSEKYITKFAQIIPMAFVLERETSRLLWQLEAFFRGSRDGSTQIIFHKIGCREAAMNRDARLILNDSVWFTVLKHEIETGKYEISITDSERDTLSENIEYIASYELSPGFPHNSLPFNVALQDYSLEETIKIVEELLVCRNSHLKTSAKTHNNFYFSPNRAPLDRQYTLREY